MAKRYRIGAGNWSDPIKWAAASGGSPIPFGPDLVTNGGFSGNANGWTLGVGWTYSSNHVAYAAGSGGQLSQNIGTTFEHAVYEVKFTLNVDASVFIGIGSINTPDVAGKVGVNTFYVVAEGTDGILRIAANDSITLDNISVKLTPVPIITDDVTIDANSRVSGSSLILDLSPLIHDFTSMTGQTYLLDMTGQSMAVYGSLRLEPGIQDIDNQMEFDMWGTTAQTVDLNGCVPSYLEFFGIGGSWQALSDIHVTQQFYQENGTFDPNGFNVQADNDLFLYADTDAHPNIYIDAGTYIPARENWTLNENNGFTVNIITRQFPQSRVGAGNSARHDKKVYFKRNLKTTTQLEKETKRLGREYLKRIL